MTTTKLILLILAGYAIYYAVVFIMDLVRIGKAPEAQAENTEFVIDEANAGPDMQPENVQTEDVEKINFPKNQSTDVERFFNEPAEQEAYATLEETVEKPAVQVQAVSVKPDTPHTGFHPAEKALRNPVCNNVYSHAYSSLAII